jgi:4-diphosphocytidyl-2-C-methyl-D-erythritol kinase
MFPFLVHARPKVNLFLHITGKRDDGYHLLDSLVVFPAGIEDSIIFNEGDSFSVKGEFAHLLGDEKNNLIMRALQSFPDAGPCAITLDKVIPPGAGLGGGSSDAAATIFALENIHDRLDYDVLDDLLLKLGADVPVCYEASPSRIQGIGDVITPVSTLPSFHIVLAWPGVPSFTKDVFGAFDRDYSPLLSILPPLKTQDDLLDFLQETQNDLTDAAEATCPPIATARKAMASQTGCALARMTGSGSCVFGLFKNEEDAKNACASLSSQNPDWWVRQGTF